MWDIVSSTKNPICAGTRSFGRAGEPLPWGRRPDEGVAGAGAGARRGRAWSAGEGTGDGKDDFPPDFAEGWCSVRVWYLPGGWATSACMVFSMRDPP